VPWQAAWDGLGPLQHSPNERATHPRSRRSAPPSYHCWVLDPPEQPGQHAGLRLTWRREARGWLGLVTFVVREPVGEGVRLIQRWLPEDRLKPAFRAAPQEEQQ